MSERSKLEQRSIIRFLSFENRDLKQIKIYERSKNMYGISTMSVHHVRKWCRLFREDRENVYVKYVVGRPRSVSTTSLSMKIDKLIRADCTLMCHGLLSK